MNVRGRSPSHLGSNALMKSSGSFEIWRNCGNRACTFVRNGLTLPSILLRISADTAITTTPFDPYAFSNFTRSGNSATHGSHQVAQKLTTTTCPCSARIAFLIVAASAGDTATVAFGVDATAGVDSSTDKTAAFTNSLCIMTFGTSADELRSFSPGRTFGRSPLSRDVYRRDRESLSRRVH